MGISLEVGILLLIGLGIFLLWELKAFQRMSGKLENAIEKVATLTNLDPLTGLANRALFYERLKAAKANAKQKERKVGLLLIDIDNFTHYKDSLGYTIEEALLQAFANRLAVGMDENKEALARITSDHFIVILEDITDPKEITEMAKHLLGLLSQPFTIHGHDIAVCVSIGISIYPDDGLEVEGLLKHASFARNHAKKLGGNTYHFYSKEMDAEVAEEASMESLLRQAISKGELVIYYQPKIDILTRKILGAEALLRWDSPILGKVSPARFIPLAEKTGLIIPIGNWILKEACTQMQEWHKAGYAHLTIAINLSPYQFKTGDVTVQVTEALWESGLSPTSLELELTETLVMENVEKSILMLKVLKAMGIQISIDDFGTGYSSLSQIQKFPVDSLKIDRSFIQNIEHTDKEKHNKAIIKTIITMAKQLGLKTIAEGVETEKEFQFLKEEGCDIVQGFLFSKPIPQNEFYKLLKEQKN